MEKTFEDTALEILIELSKTSERHTERIQALEERFEKYQFALIFALKQSGIDLVSALTTLEVPAATPPV
jgi:hypothetical protein